MVRISLGSVSFWHDDLGMSLHLHLLAMKPCPYILKSMKKLSLLSRLRFVSLCVQLTFFWYIIPSIIPFIIIPTLLPSWRRCWGYWVATVRWKVSQIPQFNGLVFRIWYNIPRIIFWVYICDTIQMSREKAHFSWIVFVQASTIPDLFEFKNKKSDCLHNNE